MAAFPSQRIYDLSVPMRDGADWYGELECPPVTICNVGGLDTCGWISHTLSFMVLNGTTYIETAAHIDETAEMLDQVPVERFLTCAHIVYVQPCRQNLPAPDAPLVGFREGRGAILICCGWDVNVRARNYYAESPYFSSQFQEWLLRYRSSIVGGDMLSFDRPDDSEMPFIRALFGQRGMALCPLRGLENLPRDVMNLCVAPILIEHVNAAPCRVFAW